MFNNKRYVIVFTKKKITVEKVTIGKKPVRTLVFESEWNEDSLLTIFSKVKKFTGSTARILVNEDFAYVTFVAASENQTKQQIAQLVSQQIPENLSETSWTYTEALIHNTEKKDITRFIQCAALSPALSSTLTKAVQHVKLTIEQIEPVSIATVYPLKSIQKPLLTIQTLEDPLFIISHQGLILATRSIENELTSEVIQQVITYAAEILKQEIKTILYSGNDSSLIASFKAKGFAIEQKIIDPVISLATHETDHENDLKLSLYAPHETTHEESEESQDGAHDEKKNSSLPVVLLLITIFVLFSGAGTFFYITSQATPKKTTQSVSSSPTPLQPSPTQQTESAQATSSAEIDRAKYKIVVLNGSGTEGAATKMKDFLTGKNFEVLRTGNADGFSYPKTQIQYQEFIPDEYKKEVENVLKESYSLDVKAEIPSQEDADILITVGQK